MRDDDLLPPRWGQGVARRQDFHAVFSPLAQREGGGGDYGARASRLIPVTAVMELHYQ